MGGCCQQITRKEPGTKGVANLTFPLLTCPSSSSEKLFLESLIRSKVISICKSDVTSRFKGGLLSWDSKLLVLPLHVKYRITWDHLSAPRGPVRAHFLVPLSAPSGWVLHLFQLLFHAVDLQTVFLDPSSHSLSCLDILFLSRNYPTPGLSADHHSFFFHKVFVTL